MRPNSVSLIVTTYNWPQALELVLLSITTQSVLPNEVIIADDGSGQATRDLIDAYQGHFPIPLIHSWQEDDGFRLTRSRNRAIANAKGEYIVMIDGDMLLHPHFIRDHLHIARKGYFTQGRRVLLTELLSLKLITEKQITINPLSKHVMNKLNCISCLWLSPIVTKLLSKKGYHSVRGCNMAYWRSDVIKTNGYNEDFVGWGREDSEFVVRLLNNQVQRQDLRFGGVAYHLYHRENSRHNLNQNDHLLEEAVKHRLTYCTNGISQHIDKNNRTNNE